MLPPRVPKEIHLMSRVLSSKRLSTALTELKGAECRGPAVTSINKFCQWAQLHQVLDGSDVRSLHCYQGHTQNFLLEGLTRRPIKGDRFEMPNPLPTSLPFLDIIVSIQHRVKTVSIDYYLQLLLAINCYGSSIPQHSILRHLAYNIVIMSCIVRDNQVMNDQCTIK